MSAVPQVPPPIESVAFGRTRLWRADRRRARALRAPLSEARSPSKVADLGRTFESEQGRTVALERISFKAYKRELVCLIGASGCGSRP